MATIPYTEKRKLVLRGDYQANASDYAMNHDISVLGLAPGAGKTEISIDVLMRYLKLYKSAKALVLTHSTNVLKHNYVDRLNSIDVSFTYDDDFNPDAQVHISLPNSELKINGKYDLVIIDEAHENYLNTKRMPRIIEKIKPKKLVLLTATPSKFIKAGGYNIHTLAANQIPEQYYAKLNIELVVSSYNFHKHIRSDFELGKPESVFKQKATKSTMETLVLSLIDRVKKRMPAHEFNIPGFFTKVKSKIITAAPFLFTQETLGKTMFVCGGVSQARDVYNVLKGMGVNVALSNWKDDKDSLEIASFKNNEYDVLVVVNRARLGYSDDNLYNIIDMSGSHNPNTIYQTMCRALRGTPDMQKFYIKVTTNEYGMMDFTHACVCAALMLTDNKYLSTFNGSNFNGIFIPIIKKPKKQSASTNPSGGKKKEKSRFVFPEFTNDVIDLFNNIIHDLDKAASIYKLTTIGEVRASLTGRTIWTEEKIWASAMGLEVE